MRSRHLLAVTALVASAAHAQSLVVIAVTDPLETTKTVNAPIVASGSLVLPDSSAIDPGQELA